MLLVITLGLTACNFGSDATSGTDASSSSSSEDSADVVTHNVSYEGTIDTLGMSIYQQGTHKLLLENGQFVLLESTDVNLNLSTYLGKRVEIRGSLQPTVEAGGMLLRAEEVIILDVGSASSDASETSEGTMTMESSSSALTSSVPSSGSSSRNSPSSTPVAASSSQASSQAPSTNAMEEQNALLAKQSYDAALWTQKYCTSHIAFCVPVHKNWYYKSFGATTNNLWHVEMGMIDIAELGDGAIVINLVSGTSSSMQAQDGQIKTQGSDVIGFKDWQDGTHFEIIADARLKVAVSHMLTHISAYAGGQ